MRIVAGATVAAVAAWVTLGASSAQAAVIDFFNDRAAFEAAAGTVVVEDFSDATLVPGLSITTDAGVISGGVLDDRLVPGGDQTSFLFSFGVDAFGGDFDLDPGGAGTGIAITITLLGGGTQLLSQEVPATFFDRFFGFTSDVAFDEVLFTAGTQGGNAETYNFDDLTFAGVSQGTAVPEPGTLALLGGGLLALGYVRRRSIVR